MEKLLRTGVGNISQIENRMGIIMNLMVRLMILGPPKLNDTGERTLSIF